MRNFVTKFSKNAYKQAIISATYGLAFCGV